MALKLLNGENLEELSCKYAVTISEINEWRNGVIWNDTAPLSDEQTECQIRDFLGLATIGTRRPDYHEFRKELTENGLLTHCSTSSFSTSETKI